MVLSLLSLWRDLNLTRVSFPDRAVCFHLSFISVSNYATIYKYKLAHIEFAG